MAAFGIGAVAGGLGVATGGLISGVGFIAGATSGAVSGFTSGTILGAGNAWASGASFNAGLSAGFKGGLLGAGTGALVGGVASGINSVRNGGDFFTGKGYSKISELRVWDNDNSLGGTADQNISNLESIQEDLGWKPGKLGVNDMNIDGKVDVGLETYYYRQPDGIIHASPLTGEGYNVRGFVDYRSTGLFKVRTDMYLSFHKSLTGLKITVNHELIHAYHAMIGLKSGGYSEFSARSNTVKYLPGYNSDLIKLAPYSSAFSKGYGWPNYLLPIY